MIALNIEQGSTEWHHVRLAMPTASQFSRIITASNMRPSSQSKGYMHELLAEWILGEPCESYGSAFMDRGSNQEDEAVKYYEFQKSQKTKKVGFCLTDDELVGCSPDRLVGKHGGLEIKIPSAKNHVAFLLGMISDEYKAQIQGCLYVTGRKWWDLVAFNPGMPSIITRFERDERFIECLKSYLAVFLQEFEEAKELLGKMGITKYCEPAIEGLEWLDDD